MASLTRGNLTVCNDVSEDTVILGLNVYDSYKYLGVFELEKKVCETIHHCRILQTLLKSALKLVNKI